MGDECTRQQEWSQDREEPNAQDPRSVPMVRHVRSARLKPPRATNREDHKDAREHSRRDDSRVPLVLPGPRKVHERRKTSDQSRGKLRPAKGDILVDVSYFVMGQNAMGPRMNREPSKQEDSHTHSTPEEARACSRTRPKGEDKESRDQRDGGLFGEDGSAEGDRAEQDTATVVEVISHQGKEDT